MSALDHYNAAHLAIIEASAVVVLLGAARDIEDSDREAGASVACERLERAQEHLEKLLIATRGDVAGEQP